MGILIETDQAERPLAETDRRVDLAVDRECGRIGLYKFDLDTGFFGAATCPGQHPFGKIDTDHFISGFGQRDRVATGAATDVENGAVFRERQLFDEKFRFPFGGFGENLVVVLVGVVVEKCLPNVLRFCIHGKDSTVLFTNNQPLSCEIVLYLPYGT